MKYFVFGGGAIGTLFLLSVFVIAKGAPQEAALAAVACAFSIVPYVVYRVIQLERSEKDRRNFYTSINTALEKLKSQ